MLPKQELRSEAKARVRAITDREERSRRMAENALKFFADLSKQKLFNPPIPVGLFMSMPTEINTLPLIQALQKLPKEYTVLVPRVEDAERMYFFPNSESTPYTISTYGIWEPEAPLDTAIVPDIIFIPGLAFDLRGGRVGRGKGYYDRYINEHSQQIKLKIALAYDEQVFQEVPMDEHDHYMDLLVTDRKIYTWPTIA